MPAALFRLLLFLALATSIVAEDKKPLDPKDADTKAGELPPATKTLADRAATAFSKRDWKTARSLYREMLQVDPENALAWANLGAVEQQSKNPDAAISCFEASVRFNAQLAQSWIALGLIYSSKGDRYKAVSAFSRAIHEDPMDARAHNYLAIEARSLGWNDAALSELQRSLELNPDYGIAHFNLAALYLDQKPPARVLAKKHYDKALALGVEKDEIIESKLK